MAKVSMTALALFGLILGLSPTANASSFMSVSDGATTLSCDNSTVAGVSACTGAGFTTSLQSNIIRFSGTVGGYSVTNITLQGNQPGTLTSAFSLDTKTAVTNVAAGSSSFTVVTASNDYILPMGSPLALSASQSGTFTQSQAGDQQAFTAYGNAANTLAATGVADSTPACINPVTAPPVQSCNQTGIPTTFSRSGNFALAGVEVITLAQGDIANFTATASTGGSGVCSGAIGNFVWNDVNHNGIQDAGEPGIPNVTVQLFDSTSTLIATTTTDANGMYLFSGLCRGDYTVAVTPPGGGFVATTPNAPGSTTSNDSNVNPSPVNLPTDSSTDLTIDFGFFMSPVCTSGIGDFVWNDLNQNGIQDAGEPGIPNITVQLFDSTGLILLATTTTNANGVYGFSGLCGGTYIVTIPSQSGLTGPGYISTLAFQGGSPANDSNGSPALSSPPQSAQVILPNNTIDTTIDFGYYVPAVGKSFTIGPSSMEGAIKISNGDWVNGGYSFSFKNNTHIATNFMVNAFVTITGPCSNGGSDTLTISLGTMTYPVPAGNTSWLPTGDANSVLSWQGSVQASGLCGGVGQLNASKGAVFHTTVAQNPPTGSLVSWRFKYRDPAAKGKPNTNCLDTSDPNRAKADVCGASWSQTVVDP